jgi:hypothetical protein
MVKIRFYLLILLCLIVPPQGNAQNVSWYKKFSGTIDKYPVTLHLYKTGTRYDGYYYYQSREEPVAFGGLVENGKLVLYMATPRTDEKDEETFKGTLADKTFTGTWQKGTKTLPFKLSISDTPFDYILVTGSKKIKKTEESIREERIYTGASIWPKVGADSLSHYKEWIRKEFGHEKDTGTIGSILIREKKEFLETKGEIYEYEVSQSVQIAYESKKLLTLANDSYVDGGGAHGMHGTSYSSFDLQNKRELGIADVLDTLTISPFISHILEEYFRKKYDLKKEVPLEEALLVPRIPMTKNVMVTSKGIGFSYVPYEIGAYALGDILIFVPYKEFEGFLKPAFKKLISF